MNNQPQVSLIPRIDPARSTIVSYDIDLGEYGVFDIIQVGGKTHLVTPDSGLLERIKQFIGSNEFIIDLAGRSRQYSGMVGFAMRIPGIEFNKRGGQQLGKILLKGLEVQDSTSKLVTIQ